MKISITTRKMVSVEQVTAALDELARENQIGSHCYDESVAQQMSEFDALKWTTLCSQRRVLQQREYDSSSGGWVVPPQFLGIYEAKNCFEPVSLENTEDSLSLAA